MVMAGVVLSGEVVASVRTKDGKIKERKSLIQRLFRQKMITVNHNCITSQGLSLIADWMLATPQKTKITSVNGYMQVGTGWTGLSPHNNSRCNMPVGIVQKVDSGYPRASNGTVIYRATFNAGSVEGDSINEVCLMNGNTEAAESLAYAELVPPLEVTKLDTLTVEWTVSLHAV